MVKHRKKRSKSHPLGKKSQDSSQFFFNYGWTVLILGAVLAALIYLGAISPDKFIPQQCKLVEGLSCMDMEKGKETISMLIYNNLGYDINNINMSIEGPGCNTYAEGPTNLKLDKKASYVFNCENLRGRFKGKLHFSYTNPTSNLIHQEEGNIIA